VDNFFDEIFGDDPPNADLSSLEHGKGQFTLELTSARFDPEERTLVYTIEPVGSQGRDLPASFGAASLFIDVGGSSWDTRLHMAVSTGGGICEANDLLSDELVMYNAKVERAPDTWMLEPNPVDALDVHRTVGITAGYQFAEGAHKNGSTFITVDYSSKTIRRGA
jgi:hypothetical protein